MTYTAMHVAGVTVQVYTFNSREQCILWMNDVQEIKDSIANINENVPAGNPRARQHLIWLREVRAFISNWGEAMLPDDIKSAVNSVEAGIGINITVWN